MAKIIMVLVFSLGNGSVLYDLSRLSSFIRLNNKVKLHLLLTDNDDEH